ncbi:hypothetical protein KJ652_03330 [Patescibacteria group bacterium]|nr:hypothetical protein [Patescibacteria group bacterium]MBU1123600.1 hypothetical protein [Patescibacteria group bacterium]
MDRMRHVSSPDKTDAGKIDRVAQRICNNVQNNMFHGRGRITDIIVCVHLPIE